MQSTQYAHRAFLSADVKVIIMQWQSNVDVFMLDFVDMAVRPLRVSHGHVLLHLTSVSLQMSLKTCRARELLPTHDTRLFLTPTTDSVPVKLQHRHSFNVRFPRHSR